MRPTKGKPINCIIEQYNNNNTHCLSYLHSQGYGHLSTPHWCTCKNKWCLYKAYFHLDTGFGRIQYQHRGWCMIYYHQPAPQEDNTAVLEH